MTLGATRELARLHVLRDVLLARRNLLRRAVRLDAMPTVQRREETHNAERVRLLLPILFRTRTVRIAMQSRLAGVLIASATALLAARPTPTRSFALP